MFDVHGRVLQNDESWRDLSTGSSAEGSSPILLTTICHVFPVVLFDS